MVWVERSLRDFFHSRPKPINNTLINNTIIKRPIMVLHQLLFPLQPIYTCKYLSLLQKRVTICPFHFWIWKSLGASLFKHPEPLLSRGKCCIPRVLPFQTHLSCGGWCPGGTSSIIHRCAPCQGLFCLHRSTYPKIPPQEIVEEE